MTDIINFDSWAFYQCVIKGHKIQAIKCKDGANIAWLNTVTLERYNLI